MCVSERILQAAGMLDIVGKGHGWKTIGDDRGFIEDTGCHPVPIRLQWCKQISRPDSKAGEEEYEPDSSENDSVKMPRIRTIVPEFWEDERFSNVSLPACLLYIGMKNFADDSGVILANETIIKSKVFPAREDIRKQQVSGWLQELIENSILVPFTFENKSYYVMDFSSERIDKPQKSKIPAEVIENVLSGKKQSNSGTFANNPEQSGMFETTPAGKESKGEDCKGEEGYTRAGTRNPDPEPEKPKNENFEKFKQWIAANAPNVAKLKEPFTEEQFERIKRDFPLQLIQDTLVSMHNYRELLKKYVSANLTFRKWAKRDLEKYQDGQTTSNTTVVTDRLNNRRTSSGTDAENKRREREHLGHLADAILQQSAAQNSK